MSTLVAFFKEAGELANHGAARALDVHLAAVDRFEKKGAADKVVKHLNGFKQLLNHQRENELISENASNVLQMFADRLIEQLIKKGVSAELRAKRQNFTLVTRFTLKLCLKTTVMTIFTIWTCRSPCPKAGRLQRSPRLRQSCKAWRDVHGTI